jgi:hypothetical protein
MLATNIAHEFCCRLVWLGTRFMKWFLATRECPQMVPHHQPHFVMLVGCTHMQDFAACLGGRCEATFDDCPRSFSLRK